MTATKAPGSVITFYSFKGGVGRSMALANIAVLLARAGKKVLCLDWDLEAPGLDRYFSAVPFAKPEQKPTLLSASTKGGLLDILQQSSTEKLAPWQDYLCTRESADGQDKLDYIGSGDDEPGYSARLAEFSWADFFAEHQGGEIIEALRKEWKAAYDFILVDSRTGLTDASGICTIQMPDVLVLLFAANEQNVDWCARVADGIRKGRRSLPFDRAFLPIVPVLARFDGSEESDRAAAAKERIAQRFEAYFKDWLPRAITPREMLNWSVLPYVPRYSFEEALAVEDEPPSGALGLSFYYDLLARLLLSRFQNVRSLLASVGVPGAALAPLLPSATQLRQELRSDTAALSRYRIAIKERAEETPIEAVEALETLAQQVHSSEVETLLKEAIDLLQDPAVAQLDEVPRLMGLRADALAATKRVQDAELLHREAIALALTLFGHQDSHTARAQVAFAGFLAKQGRKAEAAQCYEQAVTIYNTNAKTDSAELCGSLEVLRDLLDDLGRWPDMLSVAQRVIEMTGANESGRALDRHASALWRCGQLDAAIENFQLALELEEQAASGSDNIAVARALNNLANSLRSAGRYAEAEPLFRRALAIGEKALGVEHPDVARACANLAYVLRDTGLYAEAEPLFRRALAIGEKVLGSEHPDVAAVCGNLACVLRDTGRYAEAESLFRRALSINEKALGTEHPSMGVACGNLAYVLCNTGRYAEAEPLMRRALSITENALGSEHPYVSIGLVYLAQNQSEAGEREEADTLWQRGLAHMKKSIAPAHDRYGRALWHYAEHLARCGQSAEAKAAIDQAITILSAALGKEHPDCQRAQQTALDIGG